MIVVAIIGILAAIAIPNFMKFIVKTKRTEAKINLEAIYKAELSWYGEYDAFSNSFNTIRWVPLGKIYYYTFSVGSELFGLGQPVTGGLPAPPGANTTSFTACAWGNIDADATVDAWYINGQKELVNMTGFDDLGS